jgi:hypothetical protein
MCKKCFAILVTILSINAFGATSWHPVSGNLMTRWAPQVDPNHPWPDYPRPQMTRAGWQSLNGLWKYAITAKDAAAPERFAGRILVPFPIESALSGVKKALLPNQALWYERTFTARARRPDERLLLHFGAVDFEATVFVNGQEIGQHAGGYQSFSLDITHAVRSGQNGLLVKVWDPTDQGFNPHGKQSLKPEKAWYTATSGIWQTVWLEPVPAWSIESLRLTPDIDRGIVKLEVASLAPPGYTIQASSGHLEAQGRPNEPFVLAIPNAHLWSPGDPYLYDLEVHLVHGNTVIDTVRSYVGMRKVEIKRDSGGRERIFLNDRYTYNLGVLDQGFWPDGIYTAPTDAALRADIEIIKSMGFNAIRKHMKIEPDRWYYHCDKLGMLVWQDMVSPGDFMKGLDQPGYVTSAAARTQFEAELTATIAQLRNHPSITTWVLFNEGWGDYDQDRLERRVLELDKSRLLNGHSGMLILSNGNELEGPGSIGATSHLADIHSYPDPAIYLPKSSSQALVLGEYGGISVVVQDHVWTNPGAKSWSYEESALDALPKRYARMLDSLRELEKTGLSASIYTQPFDVELEANGLVTYDREVMKIPRAEIQRMNTSFLKEVQMQAKQ